MSGKKLHRISSLAGRVLAVLSVALLLASCRSEVNDDQMAYRTYGIKCLNEGKYEDAITAFQGALNCSNGKISNVEIDVCLYKAKAQFFSGDNVAALETYNALLEYKEIPEAYYQRACLYLATGQKDAALSDFEGAVRNDKKNYELYLGIYDTMHAYGYEEDAQTYLNQGLEISGSSVTDLTYKGRLSCKKGDYAQAQTYLQQAIDGGNAEANLYMADVMKGLGDNEGALSYLKVYMNSDSVTADALVKAVDLELESGNYTNAISFYESALNAEGMEEAFGVYKKLAIAKENLYDFAGAKEALSKYLEGNPEDEEAARELVFLESRTL